MSFIGVIESGEGQVRALLGQRGSERPEVISAMSLSELIPLVRSFCGGEAPDENIVVLADPTLYRRNLSLPSVDGSTLEKLARAEIEDAAPFEVHALHVTPVPGGKLPSEERDVHVYGSRQGRLSEALKELSAAGLDPEVVTTTGGLFRSLFTDPSSSPYLAVIAHASEIVMIATLGEQGAYERVLPLDRGANGSLLAHEVALFRAAVRQRYGVAPNDLVTGGDLEHLLALPARLSMTHRQHLSSSELDEALWRRVAIEGASVTPNLRHGPFRFRAGLEQLLILWRRVRVAIAVLVLVLIATPLGVYLLREAQIQQTEASVVELTSQILPEFSGSFDKALQAFEEANRELESQLAGIGNPTEVSPLEVILSLSAEMPPGKGISVRRVQVKGTRIIVDGSATDYTAVEELEAAFRARKDIFQRVRTERRGDRANQRQFQLEIFLNG